MSGVASPRWRRRKEYLLGSIHLCTTQPVTAPTTFLGLHPERFLYWEGSRCKSESTQESSKFHTTSKNLRCLPKRWINECSETRFNPTCLRGRKEEESEGELKKDEEVDLIKDGREEGTKNLWTACYRWVIKYNTEMTVWSNQEWPSFLRDIKFLWEIKMRWMHCPLQLKFFRKQND